MIILRTNYFSAKKKKEQKKEQKRNPVTAGDALMLGGYGVNAIAGADIIYRNPTAGNSTLYPHLKQENTRLFDKLKERAEKNKIAVDDTSGIWVIDNRKKQNFFTKLTEKEHKDLLRRGYKGGIRVDDLSADTLSHEIGHGEHILGISKGTGGKIGRFVHKVDKPARYIMSGKPKYTIPGIGGIVANGVHSGYISRKRELEGKKDNIINRHRAWAVPAALMAPVVAAEGMASARGLNILKQSGASKEYIRRARRSLAGAGLTYLGGAAMITGVGEASRELGKKLADDKYKNKEK
jgi:hypothetical protein